MHYKFPSGHEMAEEYNINLNVLIRRAWRKKTHLQKSSTWEVEVGDPDPQYSAIDSIGIKESSSSVSFYHISVDLAILLCDF